MLPLGFLRSGQGHGQRHVEVPLLMPNAPEKARNSITEQANVGHVIVSVTTQSPVTALLNIHSGTGLHICPS